VESDDFIIQPTISDTFKVWDYFPLRFDVINNTNEDYWFNEQGCKGYIIIENNTGNKVKYDLFDSTSNRPDKYIKINHNYNQIFFHLLRLNYLQLDLKKTHFIYFEYFNKSKKRDRKTKTYVGHQGPFTGTFYIAYEKPELKNNIKNQNYCDIITTIKPYRKEVIIEVEKKGTPLELLPFQVQIEKLDTVANYWILIKREIDCECFGTCKKDFIKIGKFTFYWQKDVCDYNNVKKKKAKKGRYRFIIYSGLGSEYSNEIITKKEFEL